MGADVGEFGDRAEWRGVWGRAEEGEADQGDWERRAGGDVNKQHHGVGREGTEWRRRFGRDGVAGVGGVWCFVCEFTLHRCLLTHVR